MPYKLSPSSLNLLEECPRCFWMHIVKKVSRPNGAFPSLPSGVDGLLKKHFDRFRDKGELPPELKERNTDAKLFVNHDLMAIWRSNFKGMQYTDKDSGIVLRGAIDDMLQKGKKLIVLDYKTRGFPLKDDTAHHYQDRLNVYNFLLRKNGYETEDYSYLLFFMPKEVKENGEFIFTTDLVKMNINVEHAEALFRKAIQVLKGDMPQSGKGCGFCEWKLSGNSE